jgi:phosphatidylinositol kinase/protein kinase (PI-3  family)
MFDNFMNRSVVLFHLREAAEQLNETIRTLASDSDFGTEEFQVEMGHLYHHLNTAWNGRDQTDEQFQKCTDQDFARFRKFPNESGLFLD